jgi:WD40 repeat protein
MFDAKSLDYIGSFVAHDSRITSILSLGDRIWTSAVEDIRAWDASSLDSLCVFKSSKIQQSKVECMISVGNRVLAGTFDGTVFMFDGNTVVAIQELLTDDSVRFIGVFNQCEMFVTLGQFTLSLWTNVNELYAPLPTETIKVSLDLEDLVPESSNPLMEQSSDEKPSKKWYIKVGAKVVSGKK